VSGIKVSGQVTLVNPAGPVPPAPDPAALTKDDEDTLAAYRTSDMASLAAFASSVSTVASGSIDRSRQAATAVVTAASAILAVYTAVATLLLGTDTTLPIRGLLGPIFLAIAIVLSTAYLAFITATRAVTGVDESGSWAENAYSRLNAFVTYTKNVVARRIWMLQGAVIALGVGAATLALPFFSPGATTPPADPPAVVSVTAWPTPPSTGDHALDSILYRAEINQAVSQAKANAAQQDAKAAASAKEDAKPSRFDGEGFFWMVFWWGIAAVLGIPALIWLLSRRTG
jgi:hypothetical protein